METKLYTFYSVDGVELRIIAPVDIEFPSFKMEYYDTITKCGAGEGIGDAIVPETILWLRVTLACYVHDHMWELSEATWKDFHHSNAVFLSNLITIILQMSDSSKVNILKNFRMYRAVTFFNAVDTIGADIFWKLKGEPAMVI